eukprot:4066267-Pyramimonas_sp.AAC.1
MTSGVWVGGALGAVSLLQNPGWASRKAGGFSEAIPLWFLMAPESGIKRESGVNADGRQPERQMLQDPTGPGSHGPGDPSH